MAHHFWTRVSLSTALTVFYAGFASAYSITTFPLPPEFESLYSADNSSPMGVYTTDESIVAVILGEVYLSEDGYYVEPVSIHRTSNGLDFTEPALKRVA